MVKNEKIPKLNEDTELTIDGVPWITPLGLAMTWDAAKQMLRNPTGDIDEYILNQTRDVKVNKA